MSLYAIGDRGTFISCGSLQTVLGLHLLLGSFSGGGLAELGRAGELVQHLRMHRAQEPGLGLIDLLVMHYLDPQHDSSDPAQHERLPFHGHGTATPLVAEVPPAGNPRMAGLEPGPIHAEFVAPQPTEGAVCCVDRPPQG